MKDKEEIKMLKKYNKLAKLVNYGNFKNPSYFKHFNTDNYDLYVKLRLSNILNFIHDRNVIYLSDITKSLIISKDSSNHIIAANIIYSENKHRWKKK